MSSNQANLLLALVVAGSSFSVLAQESAPAPAPAAEQPATAAPAAPPKESATQQLIRVLKERKAISRQDADRLLRVLQEEQAATPVAPPAPPPPPPGAPGTDRDGRIRVMRVPANEMQKVKDDVTSEVREEIISTAHTEGWLKEGLPSWMTHLAFDGDVRLREEVQQYDSKNFNPDNPSDTTKSPFVNFQALNSGPPVDVNSSTTLLPLLNTTKDRELYRIRGRLNLVAAISDEMSAGLRLSTGGTSNPVSANQTLGSDFNKLSVVFDRFFLQYNPNAVTGLQVRAGRIPNPWASTDLVWHNDLGFDGIASQLQVGGIGWRSFATAGVFSLESTPVDFPSNNAIKVGSHDKYLFAAQLGADWVWSNELRIKPSLAFYEFNRIEGRKSSPCIASNASVICDTDNSRPAFVQKGNTMFAIRNVTQTVPSDPEFQYFGLASPFRVANALVTVDSGFGASHLLVDFDYAINLAYDSDAVLAKNPENNFDGCTVPPGSPPGTTCVGPYDGGNQAFLVQARYGALKFEQPGDWNLLGGYKHLDSDAVVDGFNDSDFHLGGTNAKGFYLGGGYGFARNSWVTARWMSATEVTGPPFAVDVFQLDVNARF